MSRRFASREIIAALQRAGFEVISQRGSHVKLRGQRGTELRIVIVKHPDGEVPAGTFASILRQAGMTRQEFERYLP